MGRAGPGGSITKVTSCGIVSTKNQRLPAALLVLPARAGGKRGVLVCARCAQAGGALGGWSPQRAGENSCLGLL